VVIIVFGQLLNSAFDLHFSEELRLSDQAGNFHIQIHQDIFLMDFMI